MKKRTKKYLTYAAVGTGSFVVGTAIFRAFKTPRPVLNIPSGLAWGNTVSPEFRAKVVQVGKDLSINPSFLMAVMRKESGINSHIHIIPVGRNSKGNVLYKRSYAIPIEPGTIGGGLIGFMRKTALGLGTTLEQLLALDGVDQLSYVEKFFANHQKSGVIGKNPSLWRLYMANFLPKFAPHADDPDFILSTKGHAVYDYNAAADKDGDGDIEVQEAMGGINKVLLAGFKKGRVF